MTKKVQIHLTGMSLEIKSEVKATSKEQTEANQTKPLDEDQ